MGYLFIIALMVFAVLLILAEIFLIPGLSVAGIAGLGCYIGAIYLAFTSYGLFTGFITLGVSALSLLLLIYWLMRSKGLDRISLHKNSDSTIRAPRENHLKIGDTGITVTRLTLIGNAEINNEIVEVKSSDGFIDEHTPVVVTRLLGDTIIVKRQ